MASWVRGKCIGKGSFGTVSLGFDTRSGRLFAVKSVDANSCLPNQIESLENEIRTLRSLPPSPHVVECLGDDVTYHEGPGTSYRNLHMEYMWGGNVADVATARLRRGKFSSSDEDIVRSQARCLVSALHHVHSQGIVHCDVKGRNVLVGNDPCVAKLADFGSSIRIGEPRADSRIMPRGSPLWMAPEVIRGDSQGPKSDLWSLGCTVIEMVTGRPAWEDCGPDTLSRIGYSGDLPEFPAGLSTSGRDFLDKCLRRDPEERWSCDQLLQHPFLAPPASPSQQGLANLAAIEPSPRCVLDWVDSELEEGDESRASSIFGGAVDRCNDYEDEVALARGRISKLSASVKPDWETEGWVLVRNGDTTACDGAEEEKEKEVEEAAASVGYIRSGAPSDGGNTWREFLARAEPEPVQVGMSWQNCGHAGVKPEDGQTLGECSNWSRSGSCIAAVMLNLVLVHYYCCILLLRNILKFFYFNTKFLLARRGVDDLVGNGATRKWERVILVLIN